MGRYNGDVNCAMASGVMGSRAVRRSEAGDDWHLSRQSFFLRSFFLLGIWFVGMIGATAALLRPTWTSTLDSYAVARMLQYQPVVSGTPGVWFADLEDNQDMLTQFKMH